MYDYEKIKPELPKKIQTLFDELRNFCLSLGNDVIEDVRMHRIVFCKSINFRWFADIKPDNNTLLIKIQKNRKESKIINSNYDINEIKKIIRDAYEKIN
ncbi:MAG: DUF5655 domain-containing protein [Thaumarchaeota archaeon]|nr:DUF5655 domain-containing protein [Nitrososphaerota archaeon]MCY3975829.1 DUF5655 domain-containing protein [Nitrososphaerota archaeon]